MFGSMFKSLFKNSNKHNKLKHKLEPDFVEINHQDVEIILSELSEIKENLNSDCCQSASKDDIIEGIDLLSITDTLSEDLETTIDPADNYDDTKSEVSSIGENKKVSNEVDESKDKISNKINSLQCLFTWNLKPNNKTNMISLIQNKYGEYNLDISSPEFTFERYIGNLIIGYELFHKDQTELAQMKLLEIGKWLEDLDKDTDDFYLSINIGLKHIMTATFIHMLFATNLTEECKWLLDDIVLFSKMDPKSRAAVHAVHAAIFTEYGKNTFYLKKACSFANKACEMDPSTPYWFYIYSLALTAQRKFLKSYKSSPTENEINTIQQAIMMSDGKNTLFNYHRMTLDKDTIVRNFHNSTNKNDKSVIEKNIQEFKTIIQMIKTIMSMEPKDPHLVVKCGRTMMTLPIKVRDFNLGKQYLTKALQMAPNDSTVLKAVTDAIEVYKETCNKNVPSTTESKKNQSQMKNQLKLAQELGVIVTKYKNGEDPVPHLTYLAEKYDGYDRCKIMAQICSYNILFSNNLKAATEQFIWLIEQPNMINNYLITQHYSSFGSKKFNLAELICNEIRLITNSSGPSSDDVLYYFKMLTKIVEMCNLKLNAVDSFMRDKLIVNSSVRPSSSKTTYQTEINSLDNESAVNKNENTKPQQKIKNQKPKKKHLQDMGPKAYKPADLSTGTNKKNVSKNGAPQNAQNKNHKTNTNNPNQMEIKLSKFLTYSHADGLKYTGHSNTLNMENIRNLQTQAEIEHYTHQLYQNTLTNSHQQQNVHGITSQGLNRPFNQNQINSNSSFQPPPFQNPHPPSLLSLRPQISQQNVQPTRKQQKKFPSQRK